MAAILAETMEEGGDAIAEAEEDEAVVKHKQELEAKHKAHEALEAKKKKGFFGSRKKKKGEEEEGKEEGKEEEEVLEPHHTVFQECHVCYEISGRWRQHLDMAVCDHCYEQGIKNGDMKSEQDIGDGSGCVRGGGGGGGG